MRNELYFTATLIAVSLLSGCISPTVSKSVDINPDDDPMGSAITSGDVRTIASEMCPQILALPEVSDSAGIVRIAVAGFKNNSRFPMDSSIFMQRLRQSLNKYGDGKIRFMSQNRRVQAVRRNMIVNRQEEVVRQKLKKLGVEIAESNLVKNSKKPVKIAVIPVINTNLVNMNGNSFSAMLRNEIVEAADGKIQFLMPGATKGTDYYLTGQFVPESMKSVGIVNLTNYIEVIENRIARGESLDLTDGRVPDTSNVSGQFINNPMFQRESELVKLMRNPALRANPNVNKRFTVMLVKPQSKVAVYEKTFLLDRKITQNLQLANFILSGEISGMSQRNKGTASDYLLISVRLTDPESNETLWEDTYETKRMTSAGIVYQ
jgi:PBP1b-binding outer membrane lipoprotein LpoB